MPPLIQMRAQSQTAEKSTWLYSPFSILLWIIKNDQKYLWIQRKISIILKRANSVVCFKVIYDFSGMTFAFFTVVNKQGDHVYRVHLDALEFSELTFCR